jgi:hypothetical protein
VRFSTAKTSTIVLSNSETRAVKETGSFDPAYVPVVAGPTVTAAVT